MFPVVLSRSRLLAAALIVVGIVATAVIVTAPGGGWLSYNPSGAATDHHRQLEADRAILSRLAVIMPVNNNTDIQFYRNTWLGDYLHLVCDWPAPGCSIVCNQESTYRTLDTKTRCFARAIKNYADKDFFIKLDDDSLTDRGYILDLMKKHRGQTAPVYISDHIIHEDGKNPVLDGAKYGNGKFYMFNRPLARCVDPEIKYRGHHNEDAVFGAMVRAGCDEKRIMYLDEDDRFIWHKEYENKNKKIDLSHIKNH
ncbi:hypothetical protein H4R18_005848 [Coemansia javaensis]|uniref:Uncharacterized protein n=1 Tax=Coemansia javaensis TaxID=2761396 RepID=A0A9W8H3Z8_9FUNG|nr:hypothetical protein H4R18_005848 [Coemansia javaensis]